MMRGKRIISMILLAVMIVSFLPRDTFALSITKPTQSVTSSKYFTALPGVYEMGDGYAVIWATNFKGTGYIQYKYNGTTYTVYDMKNGIVRTGDTVHVVKVPYAHLQGNSYTVYSTEVTGHSYALTNYGTTVSAGPIKLKAYDGGSDFDILVLTDTHGKKDWTVDVASKFSGDPDLVVFSGDIEDKLDEKSDIANMFNIMGTTTGGRYPIVYCRGNHEIRDVYSTALLEYFPTKTGEFYFDFTYGPLWAVVMDNGEDKEDTHEYYGNLANFKEYNTTQEAWLRSLRPNPNATYRLSINHIPDIYKLPNNIDLSDSVGHLGIQFAVSGHKHWSELYSVTRADYRAKLGYETLICGGYGANIASWLKMSGDNVYITTKRGSNVTATNTSAENASHHVDFNNYRVPLSKNKTGNPAALALPEYGTNNLFNPTVASKGTVSLVTQPAVFESGGDWYNVVWKTTDSGAKGVTGYVEYTYNGTTYQQFEEVGGYRRTCDDFHTVKVPKKHLNNNTYRVGSFLMEYGSTSTGGRYYTSGDWVESQTYLFENKTDDAAVSIISCPDLELNSDSARLTNAKNAVAGLGTSPAYVVMNGNAAAVALYGGDELTYLLKAAAAVSGSIHPVILSRGFTECRGATAANLMKYIPTATGEFYYTVDVGDYTLVNLDTAEDQADNATAVVSGKTVSKYGNRVFFDSYRKTQLNWINSLPSGKLIALSSTPLAEVNSVFGLNYESALKNKGAVLSISGHSGSFSLDSTVNGSNIYTVTPGGRSDSGGTDVVSVLLSDDYAYITDCKSNSGTTTCPTQTAVCLSNGKTLSQGTSQPPLVNGVYEVSTAAHLRWISANCTSASSFSGKTFRLVNDIDLQLVPFTPIGGNDTVSSDENTTSSGFAGTFDGNGHTVKNVNIHSPGKNNVGFFGLVRQGTVKNLTVSGGRVNGNWYVGGFAGAVFKGSVLQNCYSDLMVYSAAGTKIGGITGFMAGGSQIIRCGNYGSVSGGHASGSAAGIVGQIVGSTTNTITSCFNTGSIAAHGAKGNAGGIFGYAGNVGAAISNCYNAAPVTSCGSAGAIMSSFSSSAKLTVSNTYFAKGYNGATTATKSSNSWSSASGSGTISGKSQSSMKSQSFANTLGSGDFVYHAASNNGYPIHHTGVCSHSYSQTVVAPTCTAAGYTTYTCSKCGDSYTQTTAAAGHRFNGGKCDVCGIVDGSYSPDYYLFGYINGANYACEEDAQTLGQYRFVNGKLTATFDQDSYVGVKTGDNRNWYMTNGWLGMETTAAMLYNTDINGNPDKLFVPGGVEVTFTLVNNGDDTLTLSYAAKACSHSYSSSITRQPTCTVAGEKTYTCSNCGHSYTESIPVTDHSFTAGKCTLCGAVDTGYSVDYYLFGYINGANYGCEEDAQTLGQYRFVNGKLTATFEQDSYVAVKTSDNASWYMTNGWQGQVSSAVLYDTRINANADKLFVPGGVEVTFTLVNNGDDTLTLSYATKACSHSYSSSITRQPTCTVAGEKTYRCSNCGHSYTESIPVTSHSFTAGKCTLCGAVDTGYHVDYYLFGYINGANYACEEDAQTLGSYQFVNGKLTATFEQDSYVAVKTSDNANWYMTDGWQGLVNSAVLYDTRINANADKLYVPGGVEVTFTLTENDDDTLTLSYAVKACSHSYSSSITRQPTCTTAGEKTYTCSNCGHSYTESIPVTAHSFTAGKCTLCGAVDTGYRVDYYLFGYINGNNYACEEDDANLGKYQFVNGKLTATFDQDSYVGIKTSDNANWYMTDGWQGEVNSAILYDTRVNANPDKLYVPGGRTVNFTLEVNTNGTLTLSYEVAACEHLYNAVTSGLSCTTDGVRTYTCSKCGHSYTEAVPALGHNYVGGYCSLCGQSQGGNPQNTEYYLFGWINDGDYGIGADHNNLGSYQFVDGKVTVTFISDSYVGVKTGDNQSFYMTNGWLGEVSSATLYKFTDPYSVSANKMMVSGGQTVTFTLTENWDGSLQLSYTTQADTCNHTNHNQNGQCITCGATVEHTFAHGVCSVCGLMDSGYQAYDYYLFGYINGSNYGCEEDWQNLGFFKFRSIGTCSATFTSDSYVAVKKVDPGTGEVVGWYMTNGWLGFDVRNATLWDTQYLGGNADKLYAPAGVRLTFTLVDNGDGTLSLSYADVNCNHTFDSGKVTSQAGCGTEGTMTYTCTNCGHYYEETLAAVGHNCVGGKCTRCGAADPNKCCTNHSYTIEYQIQSSCTEAGLRSFRAACGATYTVSLPFSGHSYNSRVETAATCVLPGLKSYTCSCGDSYCEPFAALGHQYQDGRCKACGASQSSGEVVDQTYYLFGSINGMDYGCGNDWENLGEYLFVGGQLTATFDTDSYVAVKTGDNANWFMTESYVTSNSATFHSTTTGVYEKMFIPGGVRVTFTLTENADGTLTLSYTTAGAGSSVILPTLNLKYPTMSFKDEVKLNIYYEATDLDNVVDMGLIVFSSQVNSYTVYNAESVVAGYKYNASAGLYTVNTNGIPAKNMGDTIWFAVYAQLSNGTYAYSKLVSYSPRDYAYALLGSGDAKLDALLVAMLNYGAAAQTYFGYHTSALLNNQVTAAQQTLVSAYSSTMMPNISGPDGAKQGSFQANGGFDDKFPSVTFGGAFAINYYCVPSNTPVSGVTMYYWREAEYNAASVLTASNATGVIQMTGSGTYKGSVTGISAKDLGDGVYVAFVYSDGATTYCSGVLPYSIGMYCNTMASYTNDFTPFAQATAVYGYYAKQYFG